ncbi:MAG: DUF4910 domain-containing protein [Kiritimatiellaeota bacterium]|nr:DUF4910 domain-containing protein [Kiritimatiellota bacterium]
MHDNLLNAILGELRTSQCLCDVTTYWGFRSTVPGPGLRAASEFLCRRYREVGLEAEVIAYPADDKTGSIDGRKNPLAWTPRSASLRVIAPEVGDGLICSYANEPLCLISNSMATPPGGVEAQMMVVDRADKDKSYEGLDVAGKVILVNLTSFSVEAQARKRGVAGVISDSICPPWLLEQYPPPRLPEDAPDLTMWSIWSGCRHERGLWGFNLSPRQGQKLRQLIRNRAEPVIVRAEVDADLGAGTSEVVNAYLPGTDLAHEEVWLLAHSSEPGAEDNASGCCMAVEVARTLKTLIDRGILRPPRRSIRFLHAVETDGYLPYLCARQDKLDRVVAGLCFDAVGNDFARCGGEMMVSATPDENASFVDALIARLFEQVAALPARRFTPDTYAMFPWSRKAFLGNDAFISNGFFDIPTPQISTWPEHFYHSAQDTPDKLSANTLGRNGVIAAMYLYLLASAGPRETIELIGLVASDWKQRICRDLCPDILGRDKSDIGGRAAHLYALGRHLGYLAQDAVKSVSGLAPDDPSLQSCVEQACAALWRFAEQESASAVAMVSGLRERAEPGVPTKRVPDGLEAHGARVAKRLRWERLADNVLSKSGKTRIQSLREKNERVDQVWDWLNGRRCVQEVWERVQFGGAVPFAVVVDYVDLLLSEGAAIEV